MTQRITVSLPDDIADRVTQEPNTSAYVAEALRQQIEREDTRALLAEHGFTLTEDGRQKARQRLAQAREKMTPQRYAQLREIGKAA